MRYIAILLLACAAAVQARPHDAGRTLLQATRCSVWCSTDAGSCVLDKTTGNPVCRKCKNRMVPIRSGTGAGGCGCPAGRYFSFSDSTCKDCDIGKYCNSKIFAVPENQVADIGNTACGTGLTTRTKRSTRKQCINAPGYRYTAASGADPSAAACPADTYNIGLNYATTCTACPPGFSTNGQDTQDSPTACLVPPGYFLSAPGQVSPCPKGSYRAGYTSAAAGAKCTSCPEGITTADKGSTLATDCNLLLPGYYASGADGDGAKVGTLCPIGWVCPGSTGTTPVDEVTFADPVAPEVIMTLAVNPANSQVLSCGDYFKDGSVPITGLWTKALGSTDKSECFIPPGHYVEKVIVPSTLYTVKTCAAGTYQADWVKPVATQGTSCTSCGTDISSDEITALKYTKITTLGDNDDVQEYSLLVRGGSDACYLSQGWGMYVVRSSTGEAVYKALPCNNNNYGASAKAYGLTASPCRNCPVGTQSVGANTVDGVTVGIDDGTYTRLYFHPLSCVTLPGYGYDGRSATKCPQGTWNAGGNLKSCTQCPYGRTTDATWSAANNNAEDDCKQAPGYGLYNSAIELCPRGTYNSARQTTEAACTSCAGQTYTADVGTESADDCSLCRPGYGGATCTDCSLETTPGYGPDSRSDTNCISCPTQTVGFSFFYLGDLISYTSDPVARSAATSAADCVSKYAQIESGLWYLAGATDPEVGATTLANCVAACDGDATCMFVSFEYTGAVGQTTGVCTLATSDNAGTAVTAFKAVPAGDVGSASVKSVSTGLYTQWQHDGTTIGEQEEITGSIVVNSAKSKAKAFELCDNDTTCAGVRCTSATLAGDEVTGGGQCWKIKGVSSPEGANADTRSLTRAVPAQFPEV